MAIAVNRLLALGGGFVAVQAGRVLGELALPFAGLMSLDSFENRGPNLYAPARRCSSTWAVSSLGAIPAFGLSTPPRHSPLVKITDFGLVDVDRFALEVGRVLARLRKRPRLYRGPGFTDCGKVVERRAQLQKTRAAGREMRAEDARSERGLWSPSVDPKGLKPS